MKTLLYIVSLATLSLAPVLAGAQGFSAGGGSFGALLIEILEFVNGTLIPFILGIGFLVFVWGMFRYFIAGGADEEARASGKNLMIWATLGFVLIIIFWGVVNLIAGATSWDEESLQSVPTVVVPETGG